MKKIAALSIFSFIVSVSFAQYNSQLPAKAWVDSVFKSLSKEEKIAQLMVVRAHSNLGPEHVAKVVDEVSKYNVGALCFFQGGPVRQANLTNYYQAIAKTPLMITIDGEWGLGMRLDSVIKFPYQLTLGAINDDKIVYQMGQAVGEQMKRIGVHVNFAPVVDVNNNPDNPVIGYRSFGEDKFKVARFGVAYMKGMQDAGIMACAKHFPGHGDVNVDSHLDLPVINKSIEQLDSLELYPFRQLFNNGVGSVMIAHLSIPAIDTTEHLPTSLSRNNVHELLQDKLGFKGLSFTDALEMKGVSKYFPGGEAAVLALIAGNDMLCLPEDVPAAIDAIQTAIKQKRLKWKDIDGKVKKVLLAKYNLGLNKAQVVDTTNLLADLNAKTDNIRKQVARSSVTVMNNKTGFFPLFHRGKIAYVGIGADSTDMGKRMKEEMHSDVYYLNYKDSTDRTAVLLDSIRSGKYEKLIIGIHNINTRPAKNYGISISSLALWDSLQSNNTATFVFGNVYAAANFCNAANLVAMHQDDDITQHTAVDFLEGKIAARGTLPVTVCGIPYGSGVVIRRFLPVGTSPAWLAIDSIVNDGLAKRAYPGCEVLAIQNGEIKYHKAFGHIEFDPRSLPITLESIYDLASVTKISATTVSLMKLYEQGKIGLDNTLGDYLPFTRGTDKAGLKIREVLLHQAGLNPYISFYNETIDPQTKMPSPEFYSDKRDSFFTIPVARNVWLRRDWNDTMLKRIVQSKLGPTPKYVYSDNDFILLGKVVEAVSGMPLDQFAQKTFYNPLGMTTTGFKPWQRFGLERTVPTEEDKYFRRQLLRGYVHDEGAAMFGGVSGHAGLFSNAYDLSLLYQMLLNGGELNGERYLKPETIKLFTAYSSDISRRGLGFDKPEKDNAGRAEPYPSVLASPSTFGHTGFTGTCVWVDPQSKLVYIFLSNRVYNTRDNNLLGKMNIRSKIQDAIYKALKSEEAADAAPSQKIY
ncbi:glycoside hydrolase family 3 N-terminal domain-containing protein [Flavisolibacter ginsengisoli]|jgi:beta-glucosidase-like glycosyl hydrolase/CubicO group peptidase (beta-lactamase class C family)|uniref:beta-N-acetylhexosaminidase n=1 Tax=Flavisolibacter ginsengisoli DSM 18119 TaxID=1121884 RepID=A0A1M4VP99_9BACT|nr:glycoside hydrolase family 3 N-terminal domain-containing protein [Flavisolibacter ginsengisoli]SHE70667.1 beta-glucosidase [Flavisolibacter ginsengisoli DSM 18119]